MSEKKETTVTLKQDKICKGSIRYATDDPKSPLQNVYISKDFVAEADKEVEVTIKPK
jgi:hypothetical protein